jgi:ECF sigma factor
MVREPVTVWLSRWRAGQKDALENIVPLVYDELRQVARGHLNREPTPHALSATTLVHETYLRLLQQRQVNASDRPEFLAVAGYTTGHPSAVPEHRGRIPGAVPRSRSGHRRLRVCN